MSNIQAIGVDRGFGATKFISKKTKEFVDSLVAPISENRAKEIMANNPNDKKLIILKDIDDKYYLIGEYVSLLEPTYAERDLRRNRDNENEIILFKVGMGLSIDSSEVTEVIVTTGLPTDDFESFKDKYESDIEQNQNPYLFSIFVGNKEFPKNIVVKKANVENQPKGTIITIINENLRKKVNWDLLKNRKYGVVDLGFNTTDLSMYVGKDIIVGEINNFSSFGMSKILTSIKKDIENTFKCRKSENDILEALSTYEIKVRGVTKCCKEIVEKGFEKNAILLVREISSKWEEYLDSLDEIVLTGGVVENEYFYNVLVKLFKEELGWKICKPDESRFANANGFYLISESILAKI